MDLSRNQKIDSIVDDAYRRMKELFDINENSPDDRVYQTLRIQKNDPTSYLDAFIHYYIGAFEGLWISMFLDEFETYPNDEERNFVSETFDKRWKSFIDEVTEVAKNRFRAETSS